MNTVFVLLCFCFLDYSSYSIGRPLYVKKMLRQATIQYDTLRTRNRNKKIYKRRNYNKQTPCAPSAWCKSKIREGSPNGTRKTMDERLYERDEF